MSTATNLITLLETKPQTVDFEQVMQVINDNYDYSPENFTNGELFNEKATNEGSCKIFSFALLNNLNQEQTLACFGRYYREDVLANITGDDHANIRNFMVSGWQGIEFKSIALKLKLSNV